MEPTTALSVPEAVAAPRWGPEPGLVHLSGVQAVVRMLLDVLRTDREAGRRVAAFVSGYQGSPLAGFDRELAGVLGRGVDVEIVHHPAVNEELAATAVMGSQLASTLPGRRVDGVLGVWYGKAPGLDRSVDALRHASWAGASRRGGALCLVGDDPAAKSSTLPSASEQVLADLAVPVLVPRSLAEVVELGHHAVALSRWSGAWVATKLVASVADGEGTVRLDGPPPVVLPPGWEAPPVTGELLTPATLAREAVVVEGRLDAARRYGDLNALNRLTVDPARAQVALVAAGPVYTELAEALRRLGLDAAALGRLGVRLAEVKMPFPLGPGFLSALTAGTGEVVVVEERRELLEHQVAAAVATRRGGPRVVGRRDEHGDRLLPAHGCLDAAALARILGPRLRARFGDAVRLPRERVSVPVVAPGGPERVPWFCPGCPHSASTTVPPGTLVGAGIGCHAIVKFMPEERVGRIAGITQMGGEGAQWLGMAPFVDEQHLVQNMGDGTFFHSGHLAVRAAVSAGAAITFKILWNGASAMTGGQAVAGVTPSALDLARLLLIEGVERVVVTTDDPGRYRRRDRPAGVEVRHRGEILAVQEALAAVPGVTVLIHDQPCATELRRARKRGLAPRPRQSVVINERVCEGCGDCQVKSNCLSLQTVDTPYGPKTRIDPDSCNVDLACLAGDCPAFTLVAAGEPAGARTGAGATVAAPLPEPSRAAAPVAVRVAGVGGAGVVTTAHLLAWAALREGLEVWGLDQTGLSQKAGAVVSDLRIGPGAAGRPNVLGDGEADLLLAADLMAAARPSVLAACSTGRTALVASTSAGLNGPMVLGITDRRVPVEGLAGSVAGACRPGGAVLDARAVAEAAGAGAAAANLVLLGVAVQQGRLPVTPAALEAAIEHNGVAVAGNVAAFRAGRAWAAAGPAAPGEDAVPVVVDLTPPLDTLPAGVAAQVAARAGDLAAYQSPRLARRFLGLVGEAWRAEQAAGGGGDLAGAVAFGYHKLLAYKDEYEVARLLLDHPAAAGHTTWLLHPPLLRGLGLDRKLRFGPWARPLLSALKAGRRLRGTPLDPFGHTALRRLERGLPGEYASAVRACLVRLSATNLAEAVELARLPGDLRGFETVKERAVTRYRSALAGKRAALEGGDCPSAPVVVR